MSERLYITAILSASEGKDLTLVYNELRRLCQETRKEKDCYRFDCFQAKENPRIFILHEEFKDKESLDFHFSLPHTKFYLQQNLTSVIKAYFSLPVEDLHE